MMTNSPATPNASPEDLARQIAAMVRQLKACGRNDLLLRAIGVSTLEELRIEAARGTLRQLTITPDYHLMVADREVALGPVHRAVYLLFLSHAEGIEFKFLANHRDELMDIYLKISHRVDMDKIDDTIDRLTNPFDNAINEKCSRIKAAFADMMDEYSASYYIIGSQSSLLPGTPGRLWRRRLKMIPLPRHLVVNQSDLHIDGATV